MDPVIRYVLTICAVVAIAAGTTAIVRSSRSLASENRRRLSVRSAYTTADYDADSKCEICFDDIGDELVSRCKCGKTYHLTCAEPTGECPYCGESFNNFEEPREARRVSCPRCGNGISGNICSCGTVIPDMDSTFLCRCGERLSVNDGMCHRCGRRFESSVFRVSKEFIPRREW